MVYRTRRQNTQTLYACEGGIHGSQSMPPTLPEIAGEDLHLAGWVSGFFDGEGSVSVMKKRGEESGSLISFFQTAEKNLPLCEKLECALDKLDFSWGCMEPASRVIPVAGVHAGVQKSRGAGRGLQRRRHYYLTSDDGKGMTKSGPASRASRLQLNQRFLHLIKPTRWRER